MEDKSKYESCYMRSRDADKTCTIHISKQVAEITICGALHFTIMDTEDFTRPTEEQIKNLHDMLCIDVKLFD